MNGSLQRIARTIRSLSGRRPAWPLLLASAIPLLLTACVSPVGKVAKVPVPPETYQSLIRYRKEYVLSPGDQLEVLVRRVPEVSHTVVIRPDGNISLPLLQDVRAGGLTPRELSEKLTTLFSKRLSNPDVTVIPMQVRQSMVYVVGDINAGSGIAVPYRDAPTVMQAVTLASGFKRSASSRDVAIIRLTDDGFLRAILVGPGGSGQPGPYMAMSTVLLQPDDIVFVPESKRSQFGRFLDDFVNRPLQGVNGVLGVYTNYRLVQYVAP